MIRILLPLAAALLMSGCAHQTQTPAQTGEIDAVAKAVAESDKLEGVYVLDESVGPYATVRGGAAMRQGGFKQSLWNAHYEGETVEPPKKAVQSASLAKGKKVDKAGRVSNGKTSSSLPSAAAKSVKGTDKSVYAKPKKKN